MIIVPRKLPLMERMKAEGIGVCDEVPEGVNPVRILILNLMPDKPSAEMELYHALDAVTGAQDRPLQVTLAKMSNMRYRSTPQEYMDTYYEDVSLLMERNEHYDGLIVNGAPFGHLEYEEVIYWQQLCVFFRWADRQVTSALYICWGAFARIFFNWGVRFVRIGFQWSGVYPHKVLDGGTPFTEGDSMLFPVSRPCYISHTELSRFPDLRILAESPITGPSLFVSEERNQVFAISHPEYDAGRLDFEYHRDLANGSNPMIPYNYYQNDTPGMPYSQTWRHSRDVLFGAWVKGLKV